MASIRSESTEITAATGAEYSEDGYSMVSLNTRDHDEFYDHRQHRDISQPRLGYNNKNKHGNTHGIKSGQPKSSKSNVFSLAEKDNVPEIFLESDGDLVKDAATNRVYSYEDKQMQNSGKNCMRESPINYSTQVPLDTSNHNHNHETGLDPFADSENDANTLNKIVSKASVAPRNRSGDTGNDPPIARKKTFDSDASHTSIDSQETEEDVCFPMQPPLHTRINGIDFDELEEFAEQQRHHNNNNNNAVNGHFFPISSSSSSSFFSSSSSSAAARKYIPRSLQGHNCGRDQNLRLSLDLNLNHQLKPPATVHTHEVASSSSHTWKDDQGSNGMVKPSFDENGDIEMQRFNNGVSFNSNNNKVEGETNIGSSNQYTINGQTFTVPDRFYFFSSQTEETVHAPDIPLLISEGQTFYNLFNGGEATWWLDCSCPTDDEMRCIAKAFGIHPLTAEDIRMQETREKVELFKTYYFVVFHTFDNDKESENFLEPINVYIVIFRHGILTFHFNPISHCANVRRRVRQLRDYVDVNSDWLCYALIDDITDSFAPVIQSIEYEADSIEDSVFVDRDLDFAKMVSRIGESRRKTMTLMRLLSGKADVIKMFSKRCQDEANGIGPALTSQINIANLQQQTANSNRYYAVHNLYAQYNRKNSEEGSPGPSFTPSGSCGETPPLSSTETTKPLPPPVPFSNSQGRQPNRFVNQPRGEIAMYLGDIQDHLLTMYQNLAAYEKIFSRSHSNYLAQLQVESYYTNTKVTEMLGKVTILGTMLVPLNVVPGLFGMNVHVPGENVESLAWFFGVVGFLVVFAIASWFAASYWVRSYKTPQQNQSQNQSQSQSGKGDAMSNVGSRSLFSSAFPRRVRGRGRPRGVGEVYRSDRSATSLPSKYSRWN